jgi:hypothetical protein
VIDKVTVFAAIGVGVFCDVAGLWCAFTGRLAFGGALVLMSMIIGCCTWGYLLHVGRKQL